MKYYILPYIPPAIGWDILTNKIHVPKGAIRMEVSFIVKFNKDCRYLFTGKNKADQFDFNKAAGVKFNIFNSKDNTVMLGWRYNPIKDVIEVVPYWHVNKSREFDEKTSMTTVELNKDFIITYTFNFLSGFTTMTIRGGDTFVSDARTFNPSIMNNAWFVNAWFGGTSLPNQLMSIDIDKKVQFQYLP